MRAPSPPFDNPPEVGFAPVAPEVGISPDPPVNGKEVDDDDGSIVVVACATLVEKPESDAAEFVFVPRVAEFVWVAPGVVGEAEDKLDSGVASLVCDGAACSLCVAAFVFAGAAVVWAAWVFTAAA